MSKYKPLERRNCGWLIISATIYSIYKVTRITVGILELIRAKGLDRGRSRAFGKAVVARLETSSGHSKLPSEPGGARGKILVFFGGGGGLRSC